MIARRSMLKAAALTTGGLMLSPLARSLGRTIRATDDGLSPVRLVFFLQGNGMKPSHIQPKGIPLPSEPSKLVDHLLRDHALPPSLEPLQPFADRMTIIQGLSSRITGPPLHSADFGALGCFPTRHGIYGETIDGALSKKFPGIFPHVGLGVSAWKDDNVIYNVSAQGRGKPLPTQCQPTHAYRRLFASTGSGESRKDFDARTSVMEFLSQDVRRLQTELNAAEKEKLDHYLNALEAMSKRQAELVAASEQIAKTGKTLNPTTLPQGAGGFSHLDAQVDIAASSLIAGLTQVVTVSSGSGMDFLEIKLDGTDIGLPPGKMRLHGIGHGGAYSGKSSDEILVAIRRRHCQSLAGLLKQLEAIPEGSGSMLDNTLIVYLSDQAESHHPKCFEWPVILIGDLGGRLRTSGRYLRYPWYGNTGHRTVANLYTTLLHAAGSPRDRFGVADKMLGDLEQDGPLNELLA